MVLRAGDRVRWTRNGAGRRLINGEFAEVLSIARVNVRMLITDIVGRAVAHIRLISTGWKRARA